MNLVSFLARLAGAAIPFALGLAPVSVAAADQRLAFSERLGVEVIGKDSGTGWCQPTVMLDILAKDPALFSKPELQSLVATLGTKVIPAECKPAAQVRIQGLDRATGKIVYSGTAAASASWALKPSDAPKEGRTQTATPSPITPPTPAQSAAPAVPAIHANASPLLGDWTGTVQCGNDTFPVTYSIFEAKGAQYRAIVELKPARQGYSPSRWYASGSADARSGQLILRRERDGIIRQGDVGHDELSGTIDSASKRFSGRTSGCYGTPNLAEMTQENTTPVLANRLLKAKQESDRRIAEEMTRKRPGRLVGNLPEGEFRLPECNGIVAWLQSHPVDVGIRLTADSNRSMLRHFDDETSQKFFGSPAFYWWNTQQKSYQTAAAMERSCQKTFQTNRDLRKLFSEVTQSASRGEIDNRRSLEAHLHQTFPLVLAQGNDPAEVYDFFSQFDTADEIQKNVHKLQVRFSALTPSDIQNLIDDANRYKGIVAAAMVEDALATVQTAPFTVAGLQKVRSAESVVTEKLGDKAPAGQITKLKDLVKEKSLEIGNAILTATADEVEKIPATVAGLQQADQKVAAVKTATQGVASNSAIRDFDVRIAELRNKARSTIVDAETANLSQIANSLDAAVALKDKVDQVKAAVGDSPALPNLQAYQKAIDVKILEIGKANLNVFRGEIETVKSTWQGKDEIENKLAAVSKIFGGTSLEGDYKKVASERLKAVYKTLADSEIDQMAKIDRKQAAQMYPQLKAAVRAQGRKEDGIFGRLTQGTVLRPTSRGDGLSSEEMAEFLSLYGSNLAEEFEGEEGKPHKERIASTTNKMVSKLLEQSFVEFKAQVETTPVSRPNAIKLAALGFRYEDRIGQAAAWKKFSELALPKAKTMYSAACDKAMESISSGNGKNKILIGERIVIVKEVVCDLADSGIKVTAYKSPGFFGEKLHEVKFEGMGLKGTSGTLVMKELEIRPREKALVGTRITYMQEKNSQTQELSLRDWKQFSGMVLSLNSPEALTEILIGAMGMGGRMAAPPAAEDICAAGSYKDKEIGYEARAKIYLTCNQK